MEPKPRPIKLDPHILAYLGDFMIIFEESIRAAAAVAAATAS
jgi:hypothetical protein